MSSLGYMLAVYFQWAQTSVSQYISGRHACKDGNIFEADLGNMMSINEPKLLVHIFNSSTFRNFQLQSLKNKDQTELEL